MPCVLVVDDHALDRKLLTVHLMPEGYTIETAADGVEAWGKLNADPERYDVVLLDRTMPRMDGMQLLTRMKEEEHLRMVPVIMQTALARRDQILEGIRAGAYYYLTKPYDVEMLRSVVRTAVEDHRGYRQLQAQVKKGFDSLGMLQSAVFSFQTVEQARDLGALLANTCPDPSATAVGGGAGSLIRDHDVLAAERLTARAERTAAVVDTAAIDLTRAGRRGGRGSRRGGWRECGRRRRR